MKTDAEILDWLERNHTLHKQVIALYVVDGYEVGMYRTDEGPAPLCKGATLREAYSKLMEACPT